MPKKPTFAFKPLRKYKLGKKILSSPHFQLTQALIQQEVAKSTTRTEIINYLLSLKQGPTHYLEIGVRNPNDNYNHIQAHTKYSVDPGIEFKENPVNFVMTSDVFFEKLRNGGLLSDSIRFDVIFIDGLHLAEQVDRDILNALDFIHEQGFVVLHDCNPPSEWHARETFEYKFTPAGSWWNGTTWKAFLKWRFNAAVHSCCVDSDWGVGILSKSQPIGTSMPSANPFFEFGILDANRKAHLNLVDFEGLKKHCAAFA